MKAAAHQRISGCLTFAYEGVALEDLDACGATHDAGEEWRMIDVGVPGEGRVERQESWHSSTLAPSHDHVPDGGAVVEGVDGEETRHLFLVFVDIF